MTELDIAESILNAVAIYKTIRSQSPWRQQRTKYLHIIQSTNLYGLMIYSKGKLIEEAGVERYYLLIVVKESLVNPMKLDITQCPTCGSEQIKQVCRDLTGAYRGQTYVVPAC